MSGRNAEVRGRGMHSSCLGDLRPLIYSDRIDLLFKHLKVLRVIGR